MSHPDVQPRGVILLQAPGLSNIPGIVHGFTTREGGISTGPYASLNVATRTGDARADVLANRQRILDHMGRSEAVWVGLKQVHGNDIVQVTSGAGPNIPADGLLTTDPQAAITVLGADCLPILITNRQGSTLGAAHAGWRGTRAKVAVTLVERFKQKGSAPSQLMAALGPCIGPCCYEVDEDVADSLEATCREPSRPESSDSRQPMAATQVHAAFDDSLIKLKDNGKFMVDLQRINRLLLIQAGVPAASIDILRYCTHCDPRFFSHRRDDGATGRQAGVIAFG